MSQDGDALSIGRAARLSLTWQASQLLAEIEAELELLVPPAGLSHVEEMAWRDAQLSEQLALRDWQRTVVSQQSSLAAMNDLASERKQTIAALRHAAEIAARDHGAQIIQGSTDR